MWPQSGRSRIWGKSDSKAHAGLGGPVVKKPPSSAGDVGSIPGQGTKISRTTQQVQKINKTKPRNRGHLMRPPLWWEASNSSVSAQQQAGNLYQTQHQTFRYQLRKEETDVSRSVVTHPGASLGHSPDAAASHYLQVIWPGTKQLTKRPDDRILKQRYRTELGSPCWACSKASYWHRVVVKESTAFIAGHQVRRMGSSCSKCLNSPLGFREQFLKPTFRVRAEGCVTFSWRVGDEVRRGVWAILIILCFTLFPDCFLSAVFPDFPN